MLLRSSIYRSLSSRIAFLLFYAKRESSLSVGSVQQDCHCPICLPLRTINPRPAPATTCVFDGYHRSSTLPPAPHRVLSASYFLRAWCSPAQLHCSLLVGHSVVSYLHDTSSVLGYGDMNGWKICKMCHLESSMGMWRSWCVVGVLAQAHPVFSDHFHHCLRDWLAGLVGDVYKAWN